MDLKNMSYNEKEKLATNPNTPEDLLRELAKDTARTLQGDVARNLSTPEDVLRELAKNKVSSVRHSVAENPNTPEDVLREMAKNEDYRSDSITRAFVARNPNVPEDVLLVLATDVKFMVRLDVAHNTKSSVKVLVTLFEYEKNLKEPTRYVIKRLYRNPKLPHIAKVIIETLFKEMLT